MTFFLIFAIELAADVARSLTINPQVFPGARRPP